jgi:hypothetical protein
MDLKNLIGKEIFLRPDFKGSIFIHNMPDYEGLRREIKGNEPVGIVETFIKSKKNPNIKFVVLKIQSSRYYMDYDLLENIFYSDLKTNKVPEIVSTKTNTTLYLSIAAAALLLFFIIKKK